MTSPAANPDLALDLHNVDKTYRGKVHALRGIDMVVGRGEVFGLLGPNGAGKSTLVKILMTVIRPSHCSGHVLGAPVGHKQTLGRIGYLPEHHRFPPYLTGAQVLDFYAALCNVPRAERRKRNSRLMELVGMTEWADKRVRSYSKGMRQRVGVAQALMNDPDLVLLDEPTDGVDPVGRRDIRDILLQLKDEGRTIFLNSHLLSELEMVCDRVAILVKGVVASQGTIDELTAGQEQYVFEVEAPEATQLMPRIQGALSSHAQVRALPAAQDEGDSIAMTARRIEYKAELETGEAIEYTAGRLTIGTIESQRVQPILDVLRANGVIIKSMRPTRPSLEDLFMQAVRDPRTGEVLRPGAGEGNAFKPKGGASA